MKFKAPLIFIVLSLPILVSAQVEVKNAEDFQTGTVLKFLKFDTIEINPGGSGAQQIWDFSTLRSRGDTMIEWMVSPGSTPYKDKFPTANQVEKYSNGGYVYVDKGKKESYLIGYVNPHVTINYPKPMLFAKRPLSYKARFSDSFAIHYNFPYRDFSGTGTVTIEADGYGKLILPNQTYNNVLRIKITQAITDTVKQDGSAMHTTVTTYAWFDGMHTSALFKINAVKPAAAEEVEYLLSEKDKEDAKQ